MADKPLRAMIESMAAHIDYWHLQSIALPRAADPSALVALVRQSDPDSVCHVYPDADSAREGVLAATEAGDRIVVFGSFVTVGDHLEWLLRERQQEDPGGAA
jgi:dihydrofolate synthase/folylpolyglutamate synthase